MPADDLPFHPERVLAIGAHPDDVEFGAGGTLGRLHWWSAPTAPRGGVNGVHLPRTPVARAGRDAGDKIGPGRLAR